MNEPRKRPSVTIRAGLIAIAFVALILAYAVQSRRASLREAKLTAELNAERMRSQAYHRQAALARVRAIQLEQQRLDAYAADLSLQLQQEKQVYEADRKQTAERISDLNKQIPSKKAAAHPATHPEAPKSTEAHRRTRP
jgi:hypothetical protein